MESFLFGFSGTTEKIFEEKKELYDVYIDNQNVKTHRESLQPLLRLNNADREKYRKLCEQRYVSLLKPQSIWGEETWKHIVPQACDDADIFAGSCCCTLRRWMETVHLMRKTSSFCTWWNYTTQHNDGSFHIEKQTEGLTRQKESLKEHNSLFVKIV